MSPQIINRELCETVLARMIATGYPLLSRRANEVTLFLISRQLIRSDRATGAMIAKATGLSRRTANRAMNDLRRAGAIKWHRGRGGKTAHWFEFPNTMHKAAILYGISQMAETKGFQLNNPMYVNKQGTRVKVDKCKVSEDFENFVEARDLADSLSLEMYRANKPNIASEVNKQGTRVTFDPLYNIKPTSDNSDFDPQGDNFSGAIRSKDDPDSEEKETEMKNNSNNNNQSKRASRRSRLPATAKSDIAEEARQVRKLAASQSADDFMREMYSGTAEDKVAVVVAVDFKEQESLETQGESASEKESTPGKQESKWKKRMKSSGRRSGCSIPRKARSEIQTDLKSTGRGSLEQIPSHSPTLLSECMHRRRERAIRRNARQRSEKWSAGDTRYGGLMSRVASVGEIISSLASDTNPKADQSSKSGEPHQRRRRGA